MTTLEEAKAFLKKDCGDGNNLYDHLSEVLLRVLVERPENVHDVFEYISTAVKQQHYQAPVPADQPDDDSRVDARAKQEAWCEAALGMLKINAEEGEPPEATGGVADVLDEANMFQWAGIGFSSSETFRLALALQRLAQVNGTSSLRFWGKILGYGADFYVAEGEWGGAPEPEDPAAEEGVEGVNKFTYWVMKDDGQYEWVRLPNVQRHQILAARHLRRFVRADLDAQVTGHPPFPGTEKEFLRAQIARITSSTVICPAGYFELNDDGEIEPTVEPEPKSAQELSDLGSWVHFSKEINAVYGRATPMPTQTGEDGEEIPWEGEEFAPLLRPLSEDTPDGWRIERLPATLIPAVGEVAVVRSLVWPGAASIAVGKKFLNVYVGDGIKHSEVPYQPQHPQAIQTGYGVGFAEETSVEVEGKQLLRFEGLEEQKDVLEDPTPPEDEAE